MKTKLEENVELFKKWVNEYSYALKIKDVYNDDKENSNGFYNFMKSFNQFLYNSIHKVLSPNKYEPKYEKAIRYYCDFVRKNILPICNKKIKYYADLKENDSHEYLARWLDLEDNFYALACYRNLKMLALYLERGKINKLWDKTIHLFENFFHYTQKIVFGEKIELVRASYFPGAGKTYAANILCAFWFGYDSEMSILRVTYSDDLCSTFIQQIGSIIGSKQYRKVFPQFDIGQGEGKDNKELYSKFSTDFGFKFSFSSVTNFYAATRYGQITGKRGNVLMIDDLIKGAIEAFDEKLHKAMENTYDTDWNSRNDISYQPVIALGTMWSNLDLLNVLYTRQLKDNETKLINDPNHKYTQVAVAKENGKVVIKSVFIAVPILDYVTDESTCPLRYTTKDMIKKRNNMDESLWNAVYQQRPCPPEEFLFSYNKLATYTDNTYPKQEFSTLPTQCYAFIDPTRKGEDFFAMGIFKRYKVSNKEWSRWYLVDCIFEQKPTKELYYEIAMKVINHNIEKLGFENNVDASFEEVMKYKLKELNFQGKIQIDPFFSSKESKQTKITNASSGMKREIVYPASNMYSSKSPMGLAMTQLTNWNLSLKYGDHDDFPDMVAMFVKYYCEITQNNTFVVLDRKVFGM